MAMELSVEMALPDDHEHVKRPMTARRRVIKGGQLDANTPQTPAQDSSA
jgi:hypothetical protein